MRILMVFHAPPHSPEMGPARRHYHVLAETAKRHEVTVLSLGSAADREAVLERFGGVVARAEFVPNSYGTAINAARCGWYLATARSDFHRLYRPAFQRALDRLVQEGDFDLVYCSTTMLGCYRLPAHLPLVGDTHNVEHDNLARASRESHELWRRVFYRRQAALTRQEELAYSSRFSVVCATSERDRLLISQFAPHVPTVVVPNGIDCEKYRADPSRAEQPGAMLFTGLMRYYPNEHGVRRFVDRVLPAILRRVPHAQLWVVGAEPSSAVRALASRHVVVTGRVPDVRPYYSRAQIAIVPLWIGGGTRVKVLEAMAMRVPVVSTALGCEGLDVRDGDTALLAATDETLADAAVRALTEPALRSALAERAAGASEEYDWRRVALQLEAAFRLAHRRPSCSSTAGISPELHRVDSTSWTPAAAASAPTTRPSSTAS